ncbi:creatininase family protein [Amycolatopsis aidingensis]|uniref:creatininase family protein n=1 Tax=Amycolatopsis aidingensis TaxID=2842453 RepID=UPI001C0C0AF8|nr:creatininase family protein [Amycolatopsis aidingensis]
MSEDARTGPVSWADCTRGRLRELLPEALVVLPIGATEQHGPHLPAGTDALLAGTIAERAVRAAAGRTPRPLVLAPGLPFGVSEHHLPFGATLSLSVETTIAVLAELARSVVQAGGRRMVLVNGHGGNRGACHAAASAVAARHGLAVAVVHYWQLLPPAPEIPGHAGEFETSMLLHLRPDLVADPPARQGPEPTPAPPGLDLHEAANWLRIDGYTDHPGRGSAERGRGLLADCVRILADRLVELAEHA